MLDDIMIKKKNTSSTELKTRMSTSDNEPEKMAPAYSLKTKTQDLDIKPKL